MLGIDVQRNLGLQRIFAHAYRGNQLQAVMNGLLDLFNDRNWIIPEQFPGMSDVQNRLVNRIRQQILIGHELAIDVVDLNVLFDVRIHPWRHHNQMVVVRQITLTIDVGEAVKLFGHWR